MFDPVGADRFASPADAGAAGDCRCWHCGDECEGRYCSRACARADVEPDDDEGDDDGDL
jgi:hypothetical protein